MLQYDAAGWRTRLTWSDGNYGTYEYNGASDLTATYSYSTKKELIQRGQCAGDKQLLRLWHPGVERYRPAPPRAQTG
jgi:hypothetical protein